MYNKGGPRRSAFIFWSSWRKIKMTVQEASEKYNISIHIFQKYESWELWARQKRTDSWHYKESDIERLSTIMTLHDIGFTHEAAEKLCDYCLKENPPKKQWKYLMTNGTEHSLKFILRRSSWTVWIIFRLNWNRLII